MTHKEFKNLVNQDKILIGIDSTVAREFFRIQKQILKHEIGEEMNLQRILITFLMISAFFSFLLPIFFSIVTFKFYAILFTPLVLFVSILLWFRAPLGRSRINPVLIVLLLIWWFLHDYSLSLQLLVITIPLPYILQKSMYKLGSTFIRALIYRNGRALEFLTQRRAVNFKLK